MALVPLQLLVTLSVRIGSFNEQGINCLVYIIGAAIALLDSVYLPLHLAGVTFTTFTYGMPRVSLAHSADMVMR